MSEESEASSSISPLSPEHRAVCLGISRRGGAGVGLGGGGGGANLLLGKSWINDKDPTCRREERGSSLPTPDRCSHLRTLACS